MTKQLPTLPGKVGGIVGWEPCVVQCRRCGDTATQASKGAAAFLILSGFRFHLCETEVGVRMCPDCLSDAVRACPSTRCKR